MIHQEILLRHTCSLNQDTYTLKANVKELEEIGSNIIIGSDTHKGKDKRQEALRTPNTHEQKITSLIYHGQAMKNLEQTILDIVREKAPTHTQRIKNQNNQIFTNLSIINHFENQNSK